MVKTTLLVRQIKRTVFLIVDGHPVQHAVKVKNWIHAHTDQIRLFYLPGYSPELNPDEMLNQDVKSNAVGRRCAKNQGELIVNTRSYLRSRQKQPTIVKHYFQEEHVRLQECKLLIALRYYGEFTRQQKTDRLS